MRNAIILGIIVLVLGATYFIFFRKKDKPEFAVKDTSLISRIEMQITAKGVDGEMMFLEKQSDSLWLVNGRWPAVPQKVKRLLEVISQLYIQSPLHDRARESALTTLKKNHTTVSIYGEDGLIKKYLVGATNNPQTANVMLLDGENDPKMVSLPGQEGYVSIHFVPNPIEWREKRLWEFYGPDLQKISVAYGDSLRPEESFSLVRKSINEDWSLENQGLADQTKTREYETLFAGKVMALSFADILFPGKIDTLLGSKPDIRLDLIPFSKPPVSLKMYLRKDNPETMFGIVEGKKELYTIQHFVLDPFLKTRSWFKAPLP